MHAPRILLAVAMGIVALAAPSTRAQAPVPAVGARALYGEVIHDETAAPLAGATVVLAAQGEGIIADDSRSSALLMLTRSTLTDATGRYRFDGIVAGAYVLRVHRLGFSPATVNVELRGGDSRISVGLAMVPVRLHPVVVEREPEQPYAAVPRTAPDSVDEDGAARVAALLQRQRRYLSTDVREITRSDVVEGLSLGETDLFRAMQRLPAVSTRNELSAELWTRNASWNRTRILFDGMPLFNPLHAAGAYAAVNEDAVGAAFLHPGVRPAALGEGSAGVLDIRSRAGGGTGRLRGSYDANSFNIERLALDQRVAGGRGAWMVALRRAIGVEPQPSTRHGVGGGAGPFRELTARTDWMIDSDHALEVSGLHEQDEAAEFDSGAEPSGNRARWGNDVVRVTLTSETGPMTARHTVGLSRYGAHVTARDRTIGLRDPFDFPISAGVAYLSLGSELAPAGAPGTAAPWTAGWELVHQRMDIAGALRAVYLGDALDDSEMSRRGAVTNVALWGERRTQPTPALAIAPGLRVEVGSAVRGAGAVRLSPRATARLASADGATLYSAAIGRSYQYTQSLPPITPIHPTTPGVVPLWLMAGSEVPVLRTDLLTIGAERWLDERWTGSLNAYVRHATGLVVPDPRVGLVASHELFVEGAEWAHGAEGSLRRVQGRWTTALGYQYGVARIHAAGLEYAPAEDRRQSFDLTTLARLGRGWRIGAAYTIASGTPFTQVDIGIPQLDTSSGASYWLRPPSTGTPSGERLPRFEAVDVLVDWSGRWLWGTQLALSLKVTDVYPTHTVLGYDAYTPCSTAGQPMCDPTGEYSRFWGVIPVLGIRIAF